MAYEYTYIIAPKNATNIGKLNEFCALYPSLVEERRVKNVFMKDANDIVTTEGDIVVMVGAEYLMLKATTADFDPSMLDGVIDPVLYNVDNLPYSTMWL